jgi:mannose-1-phosphate guanylyltransferase
VIVQPQNRGTAAGLLLPLSHPGLRRDTRARVLVLASDHHVGDERTLRESLDLAVDVRGRQIGRVLLLGMTPSDLDDDYGWIVPASPPADGIRRVAHFAEKPGPDEARALRKRGALVNSLMLVAQARLIRQLYEEALPETFVALRDALGDLAGPEPLDAIYARIPTSDLSRDVLAPSVRRLSVVHVPACGWSDLGTPLRLRTIGICHPREVHREALVGGAPGGSIPLLA